MKLFFPLLLLSTVSAFSIKQLQTFYDLSLEYKQLFLTSDDFIYRFNVFLENDEYITSVNDKNLSYTLAHNQFSFLTADEFNKQNRLKQYNLIQMEDNNDNIFSETRSFKNKDEEWDWTEKGAVTPVKNQEQCGSCWAFSTTGSMEGAYFVKNNKLESFSEQMLVDCDTNDLGCYGGLMNNAFKWIQSNGGIELENDYPYTALNGKCEASVHNVVEGTAPSSWTNVKSDDVSLMAAIKQQPVSVAIEADQSSFQFYSSGVLTGRCGTNLDHGVLAVGYGTLNGIDYYKVKNSWGESWGMDGYVLLERNDSPSGQCGILLQASFPNL